MPTKDDSEYIDNALRNLGIEYNISTGRLEEIIGALDTRIVDVDSLFREVDNWGVF